MKKLLNALILDDSQNDALLLVRELGRQGFDLKWERVWTAPAMESSLVNGRWDVVLSDYNMPGFDVHQWLTANHPGLANQVIFITGGAFTPRAREYLARAQNLQLEKPFDAATINNMINERVIAARARK